VGYWQIKYCQIAEVSARCSTAVAQKKAQVIAYKNLPFVCKHAELLPVEV
jgi:hypothetical protein